MLHEKPFMTETVLLAPLAGILLGLAWGLLLGRLKVILVSLIVRR